MPLNRNPFAKIFSFKKNGFAFPFFPHGCNRGVFFLAPWRVLVPLQVGVAFYGWTKQKAFLLGSVKDFALVGNIPRLATASQAGGCSAAGMRTAIFQSRPWRVYHQTTGLDIINASYCISSSRRRYTLARDDMLAIGEMICRLRRMIYQVCDLDKQKRNFCLPKVPFLLVDFTYCKSNRLYL